MDGTYHAGLDGLRAVAVTLVVLYHFWPHIVVGGYLGVGLFFTLSGFLIVGLLDSELGSAGKVNLRQFAMRRVKRLVPASLLTLSFTALAVVVVAPERAAETGNAVAAAVLNVHNWWSLMFRDVVGTEPNWLDHFWSLAVEEQFYLLVPAAIALTRRPVAVMWSCIAVGGSGSYSSSGIWEHIMQLLSGAWRLRRGAFWH